LFFRCIANTSWTVPFINGTEVRSVQYPAAQALSVTRQNWDFGVKAYFNRPEEMEKIFTQQQIRYGQDILRRGNIWETAILDWVVSTHHGRISTRSNLTKIMLENLVTNPADFVESELIGKMGLTDADRMLRLLKRPSSSSNMSSTENINSILNGDSDFLLSSWVAKLDDIIRSAPKRFWMPLRSQLIRWMTRCPKLAEMRTIECRGCSWNG